MAANRPVRNRKAPSKLSYSVLAGDSLAGEFVQGLRKSTQSMKTIQHRWKATVILEQRWDRRERQGIQ